jgi:hypothetical protein
MNFCAERDKRRFLRRVSDTTTWAFVTREEVIPACVHEAGREEIPTVEDRNSQSLLFEDNTP